MVSMIWWGKATAGLALTMVLMGWGQPGQTGEGTALQREALRQHEPFEGSPRTDRLWNEKRMRALNEDRHKSMVSDAERLLKLARQLDAEVASNPTDEMTPEELHKIAEIEKLARSVKSKMALSFTGGPQLQSPGFPTDGLDGPIIR